MAYPIQRAYEIYVGIDKAKRQEYIELANVIRTANNAKDSDYKSFIELLNGTN